MARDMSTRASLVLATALGHTRYGAALLVIGFGVFAGWCVATAIPVIAVISAFDMQSNSPRTGLAAFFGWLAVSTTLTVRCRHWIIRKAVGEAPPQAVTLWPPQEIMSGGFWVARAILVIPITVAALSVAALAIYAAYLILTSLSVAIAIILAAIVVAIAIVVAASSRT